MRKVLDWGILILIAVLTILPLCLSALGLIPSLIILDSERVLTHLVFVFVCFSGIITFHEKKHLNIDVFFEKLSPRFKKIVEFIDISVCITILTALFFACIPNILAVLDPHDTIWSVPIRLIYAILPLMYLGMVFVSAKRSPNIFATIIGLFIGLIISTGSIATIMYHLFGSDAQFFSSVFNEWMNFTLFSIWPLIIFFVVLTFFGVPLFIIFSGIAYVAFSANGGYVDVIPLETYNILTDTGIAAIPLFTITGYLLAKGSAGQRLLDFVKNTVGWIRGGTIIATVIVAAFFTTFTGASGITILALGGILCMILTGSGYSRDNAESLITASGSVGLLFPPSMAIIVYGATNIMTVNMIDLFKGSFLPGVLLCLSMVIIGIVKDTAKVRVPFSKKALHESFKKSFIELLLPATVILAFFSGAFSLFETAAISVFFAFVLEVFIRRDFSLAKAKDVILESIPIAGGVLIIISAAKGLAYFLIDANIPFVLSDFVLTFVHSKYLFLLLLNILLLIVGCLMDVYSAILVVSPLIVPIADGFGIHPVHTGVIFLFNLSLGFLTPPVGMNLFIAGYTFNRKIPYIVKRIIPYLAMQGIILLLITYIPWFSLALVK